MSDAAQGGAAAAPAAAPAEPAATPEPANDNATPAEPSEYRGKAKIGEEERDYSWSELVKLAEKGQGAEKKFREAAQLRKEVESFVETLPQDIPGALTKLIGDKSRAARHVMAQLFRDPEARAEIEQYLVETYDYESLPHEERKKVDEHRDLRAKAEELERIKQREAQSKEAQLAQQYEDQFAQAIEGALQQAGVPINKATWRAVVADVEAALSKGKRLTREDFAAYAKAAGEEHGGSARGLIEAMEPAKLASFLGPAKLAELRKWEAEQLKPKGVPEIQRMPGNGKARAANDNGRSKAPKSSAAIFRRIRGED